MYCLLPLAHFSVTNVHYMFMQSIFWKQTLDLAPKMVWTIAARVQFCSCLQHAIISRSTLYLFLCVPLLCALRFFVGDHHFFRLDFEWIFRYLEFERIRSYCENIGSFLKNRLLQIVVEESCENSCACASCMIEISHNYIIQFGSLYTHSSFSYVGCAFMFYIITALCDSTAFAIRIRCKTENALFWELTTKS